MGRCTANPCPVREAVDQVVKSCEVAMNHALILDHEVKQLRSYNQRQKRKRETSRTYVASGAILTGAEAPQCVQEMEE